MPEPAAPPAHPEWLPSPEEGGVPTPCGRWWDAVRVDAFDGVRAIAHLGDDSGPLVEDTAAHTMTWLVHTGTTAGWQLRGVPLLRQGQWLTIPPTTWQGSLRWQRAPAGSRGWLTRPTLLHEALQQVAPRRQGTRRA